MGYHHPMPSSKKRSETIEEFCARVLVRAIAEIRAKRIPVYTFAFYHDHESAAVSVCVDTKVNSARMVVSMNAYGIHHFIEAVNGGDLKSASLWNANIGRSLSLGDFILVNVARADLNGIQPSDRLYLAMIRAVVACESEIAAIAENKEELLFCCSGPEAEVKYIWSATA